MGQTETPTPKTIWFDRQGQPIDSTKANKLLSDMPSWVAQEKRVPQRRATDAEVRAWADTAHPHPTTQNGATQ